MSYFIREGSVFGQSSIGIGTRACINRSDFYIVTKNLGLCQNIAIGPRQTNYTVARATEARIKGRWGAARAYTPRPSKPSRTYGTACSNCRHILYHP